MLEFQKFSGAFGAKCLNFKIFSGAFCAKCLNFKKNRLFGVFATVSFFLTYHILVLTF